MLIPIIRVVASLLVVAVLVWSVFFAKRDSIGRDGAFLFGAATYLLLDVFVDSDSGAWHKFNVVFWSTMVLVWTLILLRNRSRRLAG